MQTHVVIRAFQIIAILTLSGCASSSTTYIAQHPRGTNEATLYIIRDSVYPRGCAVDVVVDGQKAASVAGRSFVRFNVSAGQRRLDFVWPVLCTMPTMKGSLGVKAGETRYLVMSTKSEITGMVVVVILSKETIRISEVPPAQGERLIHQLTD
jgi:hypothetical protein